MGESPAQPTHPETSCQHLNTNEELSPSSNTLFTCGTLCHKCCWSPPRGLQKKVAGWGFIKDNVLALQNFYEQPVGGEGETRQVIS